MAFRFLFRWYRRKHLLASAIWSFFSHMDALWYKCVNKYARYPACLYIVLAIHVKPIEVFIFFKSVNVINLGGKQSILNETQSFLLLFTGIYRPRFIGYGPIIHSVFSVWHWSCFFSFNIILNALPLFWRQRLVKGVKPICCRLANTVLCYLRPTNVPLM